MNPARLIMIGILLLLGGAGLYFKSSKPSITAEEQASCIQQVQHKYDGKADAQLVEMCKTSVGWVAQMNAEANGAHSAQELAKAISSANQQEVGFSTIGKFLMGLCVGIGLIMVIKGLIGLKNKTPENL